jgi:transcriptional regulator with XRE-family HTH domain
LYTEQFPNKLKEARKRCGMTQEEIAKELGLPRGNIANYETGRREPDLETIAKLANYYNVSTDWLLGVGKQKQIEN